MNTETKEIIERLRANLNSPYDVMLAFMGYEPTDGWRDCKSFQEALIDLLERSDPDTHMELPVDVDGVPIHVGDEMERGSKHGRVVALMLSNYPKKWGGGLHWGVQLEGEQAPTALDNRFHHYHKPTVEELLRSFLSESEDAMRSGYDEVPDEIYAEYAKRLRLAESDG